MAITKTDCLLLLAELQKSGVDTTQATIKAARSPEISLEVIKFINDNRPLEVQQFYEKLRESYNDKRSKLYKNIVLSDEKEPKEIVITLSSLQLQTLLYSKNCKDPEMFLRNARFDELSAVLYNYSKTYDTIPCVKLLRAVKADLKAFEYISREDFD